MDIIENIVRAPGAPNNKNQLWLHNGVLKYWDGISWAPIAGSGEGGSGSITPSDMKAIQKIIEDYLDAHPSVTGTFSNSAKRALLNLLSKVAYIDTQGQDYLDNLRTLLFSGSDGGEDTDTLSSITAVYTPGEDEVIYDINSVESLRNNLVVTANYSAGDSEEVTDYVLSGTLAAGTSVITVTYENATTTFSVTVVGTTKLYASGDECTALTGGWEQNGFNINAGDPVAEKNEDHLLLKFNTSQTAATAVTLCTVNPIDLTGKTKILVDYEAYNEAGNGKCWVYYAENLANTTVQKTAFGDDYSDNRELLINVPVDGPSEYSGLDVRDIVTAKTSVHICLNLNCFVLSGKYYSDGAFFKIKNVALL